MLNSVGEPGHLPGRRVPMKDPFGGGLIDRGNGQGEKSLGLAQIFRCNRNMDVLHQGLDAADDRPVVKMALKRLPLSLDNRLMDLDAHSLNLLRLSEYATGDGKRNPMLKSREKNG
jgi:hypothetical protein